MTATRINPQPEDVPATVRIVPGRDSFDSATELFYRAYAEEAWTESRNGYPHTMTVVAYGLNIVSDMASGKIRPINTFDHFRQMVHAWTYENPGTARDHGRRERFMVAGMIDLVEGLLR